MIAAFVLIAGVLIVMVVGAAILISMKMGHILTTLVPLAPLLVAVGTLLLIFTELLLFFGGKEDRRAAMRDLAYLVPTLIISLGLFYFARVYLW